MRNDVVARQLTRALRNRADGPLLRVAELPPVRWNQAARWAERPVEEIVEELHRPGGPSRAVLRRHVEWLRAWSEGLAASRAARR
ncbi:hypothetical protein [Brachybacterium hainanense]|uniref:Uncharacterized protein n=1 Tax=Brachybacterium hainanense TaxID=1541174 RepID=A0ABV6R9R9_9MICO